MSISALPITPVQDISANGFTSLRLIEAATQTFITGTPVALNSSGQVIAWSANTQGPGQGGIVGIAYEAASDVSAAGAGVPPFDPFYGAGAVLGTSAFTFPTGNQGGSPLTIFHGAPINDTRVGFVLPGPNVVFSGMFGNNGNTATPAGSDIGKQYGLTVDSNSTYWYVDKNKTAAATNTVLTVIGFDPRDTVAAGSRVLFTFLQNVISFVL